MCFSATASFLTAGVTGAIGIACLGKTGSRQEWPLAAMPILFGIHQSIEGFLWITLPLAPDGVAAVWLTLLFLLLAKVLWPVYAPAAALLIEPDGKRRWLMVPILAAGIAAGSYFLWSIIAEGHSATIANGRIVYRSEALPPIGVSVMYMLATCATVVLSSHLAIQVFAGIFTIGAWTTYVLYWESFTSVWCFFAAAASIVVLLHFTHLERLRPTVQAPIVS
jgi:hypothetical protein